MRAVLRNTYNELGLLLNCIEKITRLDTDLHEGSKNAFVIPKEIKDMIVVVLPDSSRGMGIGGRLDGS